MTIEVTMPLMGEGVVEAKVVRWLKQEGDSVKQHDPLVELETDKVTTELEAEASGTLLNILVPEGEMIAAGSPLATIGSAEEAADNKQPEPLPVPVESQASSAKRVADVTSESSSSPQPHSQRRPKISPLVARMVKVHQLDVAQIAGTGRDGRVTKKDVQTYLDQMQSPCDGPKSASVQPPLDEPKSTMTTHTLPADKPKPISTPSLPVAATDMETVTPLSSMRRAIADHMVHSKKTSPHVTTVFEVDFSTVMAHRREYKTEFAQQGVKLTLTPYIVMATAQALRRHPQVNSRWSEAGIVLRQTINLGMAVAIPDGLIVPVIAQVEELSLLGLARRVNDLAERARNNRLQPHEVTGGTFTLTNHGVSGSLFATPIINQPQCGILGVGKIQKRVVVLSDKQGNDMMAIRPMAYLSFTFDHRILDGATADAFVSEVQQTLEGWR